MQCPHCLKHFHETWTHAALIPDQGRWVWGTRIARCPACTDYTIMLGEVQQAAQGHPILGKESSFKMVYPKWSLVPLCRRMYQRSSRPTTRKPVWYCRTARKRAPPLAAVVCSIFYESMLALTRKTFRYRFKRFSIPNNCLLIWPQTLTPSEILAILPPIR